MRLLHVVGARPNFMKLAPVHRALASRESFEQSVVHTGQHYDRNMSEVFFRQLEIPQPHVNLAVGSGTHARQTAEIMLRLEPVIAADKPDMVLVYGDVNSTVAAALLCSKLLVPVAHVEAGLRSFDRTMPEEINRIVTDRLCDLLFTPSQDGDDNLRREGVAPERIHLVGNVMIDTLVRLLPEAQRQARTRVEERYALVTLHRPGNVDDLPWLKQMLDALHEVSAAMPVLFPLHPRTRQRMGGWISEFCGNGLRLMDPLPYLEFLALQARAAVVITDSGGIQEETTFLGIPCLTVRENTERPVTVTEGTNVLVGRGLQRLRAELDRVLRGETKTYRVPMFWDGHAGERIADVITSWQGSAAFPARA